MELMFDREQNRRERLSFVRTYAAWVRCVPNEVWSSHQAALIDSFLDNAKNYALSRSQYLELRRPHRPPQ